MTETFDTIVIGSGCGGAAAAALTSYHGCKTLLLEKSKIIGGRCGTIEKQGFKMDHGHLIARGKRGPHGDLLKIVKCEDLIPEWVDIPHKPIGIMMYGQKWELGLQPSKLKEGLLMWSLLKAQGFLIRDIPGIVRLLYKISRMEEDETKSLDQVGLRTFLSRYTDSELIHTSLSGLAAGSFGTSPDETSAGETIRTIKGMRKAGRGGYPVTGEGISAIPKSFLRAAERYGAEIRTTTPVERIVVENGEAKGVKVKGEFIPAKMIISNAGIKETSFKLVGKNHFQEDYVAYLENLKYGYGGISLKYALDKRIVNFGAGFKLVRQKDMSDALEGKMMRDTGIMFVCTSNFDPSLAPPGKQLLLAVVPGSPMDPEKTDWDPWIENAKRQVEEFIPGISKHTLFCEAYTPVTIARQNSRYHGDACGVAQTTDQVGDNTPSAFSPIKNLYHAGTDVGSKGVATEMATESAIDLIEELKRRNLLH